MFEAFKIALILWGISLVIAIPAGLLLAKWTRKKKR